MANKHKKSSSKFRQTMMKNTMIRNMAKNPMAEIIGWGAWVVVAIVVIFLIVQFITR